MSRSVFVWGAGGVGKSHVAIRSLCESKFDRPQLLITMDPSYRVLDLLGVKDKLASQTLEICGSSFDVKATDALKLFDQLAAKKPPNEKVKVFYDRMVGGLQEFRDYLALIQLADELSKSQYPRMIIDTPPFQEAVGLHRSLFNLKEFFEKSLVQLAVKTAGISWLHSTVKKVFEATRVFVGKGAADQVFEFIEWLSFHTERFKTAAHYLEELIFSKETLHRCIVTPETKTKFFEEIEFLTSEVPNYEFVMNRSTLACTLPEGNDSFLKEFRLLQEEERRVESIVREKFPHAALTRVPFILMGEDTREELQKFASA